MTESKKSMLWIFSTEKIEYKNEILKKKLIERIKFRLIVNLDGFPKSAQSEKINDQNLISKVETIESH